MVLPARIIEAFIHRRVEVNHISKLCRQRDRVGESNPLRILFVTKTDNENALTVLGNIAIVFGVHDLEMKSISFVLKRLQNDGEGSSILMPDEIADVFTQQDAGLFLMDQSQNFKDEGTTPFSIKKPLLETCDGEWLAVKAGLNNVNFGNLAGKYRTDIPAINPDIGIGLIRCCGELVKLIGIDGFNPARLFAAQVDATYASKEGSRRKLSDRRPSAYLFELVSRVLLAVLRYSCFFADQTVVLQSISIDDGLGAADGGAVEDTHNITHERCLLF